MQEFHKTILIVCEGESTEPDYFSKLNDLVLSQIQTVAITIKPRPKGEYKAADFKLREGGKLKQIKNVDENIPLSIVEDEFVAQPTRYVREAQLGLEDGTYDEVWAIFDKDNHPNHKEAFDLANKNFDGKYVNIAFNSIAFEYWLLLHFEFNTTAFQKSMCREGKDYFYCGSSYHQNDCFGENCVCGRIVQQKYLNYLDSKKSFDFASYHSNVDTAISRAIDLRHSYIQNTKPIYELNPFTNTDRLVFKLLQVHKNDYTWFDYSADQIVNNFRFRIIYQNKNIEITIVNISNVAQFINPDTICLIDINGNIRDSCVRKLIFPEESVSSFTHTIDLNNIHNFVPVYIGYKIVGKNYLISEIFF